MAEIILGFGETSEAKDGTERIVIEVIAAPVDHNDEPLYAEAYSSIVNLSEIPLLILRSICKKEEMGRDQIKHKRSIKSTITFTPSRYKVTRLGQIPEANKWFADNPNNCFQKLRHMNVLAYREEIHEKRLFLIPSTVIANYYLGHSLLLKEAVRQTPSPESILFDPALSIFTPPFPHIFLKNYIPAKLAPHIARFRMDPYANAVFKSIHSKSLFSTISDQPASFYMSPPTSQTVTWNIECVGSANVCWVTQIISCTSSFPFSSLLISSEKSSTVGEGLIPYTRKKRIKKRFAHDKPFKLGTTSDPRFETTEIDDPKAKNEYPGLKSIKINKIIRLVIKDKKFKVTTLTNTKEILAFLGSGPTDAGNPNNIVPTEISSFDEPDSDSNEFIETNERLERFFALISKLEETYNVDNLVLEETTPQTPPIDINVLPYSYELLDVAWCREYKLTENELEQRRFEWDQIAKRFFIKKILINGVNVYIIEFIYWRDSDKGCTLVITSTHELSSTSLLKEITGYAKTKSSWKKDLSILTYKRYRVSHEVPDNYVEVYSKKIITLALQHDSTKN